MGNGFYKKYFTQRTQRYSQSTQRNFYIKYIAIFALSIALLCDTKNYFLILTAEETMRRAATKIKSKEIFEKNNFIIMNTIHFIVIPDPDQESSVFSAELWLSAV